jgi:hypothetical protein
MDNTCLHDRIHKWSHQRKIKHINATETVIRQCLICRKIQVVWSRKRNLEGKILEISYAS